MSEVRVTITDWIIKTSDSCCKKSLKIELFSAAQFRDKFSIYDRSKFYPLPPFQTAARNRYWQQRYRIRVNGKWFGDKAKYHTFTVDEVFNRIVKRAGK